MDFHALGNTCVVGLQWGDEGKGKIVDILTEHFDVVVRTGGGANAGHTVQIGDDKFALHLLPTGVLRPNVLSVIGPGVAVDLDILSGEIDALRARGIEVGDNLLISNRAHLVMPYHKKQDRLTDAAQGADTRIGTTAKGIGPCYADKMLRTSAFRVVDLQRPDEFRPRLRRVVAERNTIFASLYGDAEPMDADKMADDALALAARLSVHVADTTPVLREVLDDGRRILFEGAQGCLLDINHGTFPFVTSSTCTAGGVAAGAGVPPGCVHDTIGIIKAYTTRVGGGPFPTELCDATGDTIRRRGHEYGTTTGRPRRCGWFDAFALRYAIGLSGVTQLVVMHLDTLGSLPEVRICTGYHYNDADLPAFPADAQVLSDVRPVYETLPGWEGNLRDVRDYDELPATARRYVDRLTELLGVPITLVSIGPDREATLHPTGEMKGGAPVRRPTAAAGST